MMKLFLFLVLILAFACNQQAQDNTQSADKEVVNLNSELHKTDMKQESPAYDMVKIDIVPDIPKGTNEKSPAFIKKRLEALVGNFLKEKCLENNLNYPPQFILFRFFKHEKEFEVWAGNNRNDSLKRILLLPVCAVDDEPGTKLEEGDGKTPEGFYNSPLYYGSTADFMWIKLNNSEIDTYGNVGYGSSFKMCLDYPNDLDRHKTNTVTKHNRPGSAICIHGNCVSIGCISFKNKNYLPVFLSALGHNANKYGPIKIHIFPFRFDNFSEEEQLVFAKRVKRMKSKQVLEDWKNLREAYNLLNNNKKAIKVTTLTTKYLYTLY